MATNEHIPADEQFSADDLAYIDKRISELQAEYKRRYDRAMAEIDKDEADARARLRQVLIRRAIVTKVGHHG